VKGVGHKRLSNWNLHKEGKEDYLRVLAPETVH
jgi:hypothetical protein